MTTRPRLLIVEDEADAAESLELLLEPRGYQVRTAATAAEARSHFEEWRPGLVLMDLMLPDASGLDLLVEFKAANSEAQVIMRRITGAYVAARGVPIARSSVKSIVRPTTVSLP